VFSGIIEELGKVRELTPKAEGGARLSVGAPALAKECAVGDSVAVNGVCLTVVGAADGELAFDLSAETLRVTDLGELNPLDAINLELSLRVGERLGGHFVSGHIDEVGTIVSRHEEGDCAVFRISASVALLALIVERGSIAVDGISLTVTGLLSDAFEVVIIPHTAKMTTLGYKKPGDDVNLEADMIGKYVAKLVKEQNVL